MSVLTCYFNTEINQCSPVQDDLERVVNRDADGNEIVTWQKTDYAALQKSSGLVQDWQLDRLLAAGINPNFPIHTGNPTRLEGIDELNAAAAYADSLLADSKNESE